MKNEEMRNYVGMPSDVKPAVGLTKYNYKIVVS